MKTQIHRLLAASLLIVAISLRAQIVTDGTTNTLINVTNTFTGDVTVGTNGSFTLLILSDNALLTNSANGVIGLNTTAKSNEVRLVSASARWQLGNTLYVGSNGSSSRLVVSNGALLGNSSGVIGLLPGSTSNIAIVSGSGSLWNNRLDLRLGGSGLSGGTANRLEINSGGQVVSSNAYVATAGNTVVVEGAGSQWSNRTELVFGDIGPANLLVVSNGGWVVDSNGFVGFSFFSPSNTVVVDGIGSVWSNRADLRLGGVGSGNVLVVSNGGWVANNNGYVGESSAFNLALVTGANSTWSNRADLSVGNGARGNQLVVSDGALVVDNNSVLGNSVSGSNNFALITGSGSLWNNHGNLYVGNNGSVNQMVVSNGAAVFVGTNVIVGQNNGANVNSLLVTGPGSSFVVGTNFYVGSNGALNRLVISSGALVMHERFGGMGVNLSSVSNEAVVTGPGSAWRYGVILTVGGSGAGNRMTITNGGLVTGNYGGLGGSEGSNNLTIVTGPGSVWSNRLDFTVGSFGSANRLIVSDGGRVDDDNGCIGQNSTANDNEALVTGPGSSWISLNLLQAGRQGPRSRLTVTNGGLVSASQIVVGEFTISTNNRVVVDGGALRATNVAGNGILDVRRGTNVLNAGLIDADQLVMTNSQGSFEFNGGTLITRGALLTNIVPFVVGAIGTNPAVWAVRAGVAPHLLNGPLLLGRFSPFNQLLVTNGALFASPGGFIGLNGNAMSNTVVVAGLGSTWSNSASFEIGSGSSFNSVVVSNGGFLRNTFSYLGQSGGNNLVLVTGPGSVWSNANGFVVGSLGSSNQLLVSDGGTVKSGTAGVGGFASSNNLISVTGTNTLLQTSGGFSLGSDGAGNQLVVSQGGRVWTGNPSDLGAFSGGNSNVALVTGAGSEWTNGNLTVGGSGSGNRLIVNNGGALRNGTAYVGSQPSGSNNFLLVTDPGSAVTGDLFAGYAGTRNQMIISNGAVASGNYGVVGFDLTGSNNLATVTGLGSVWSNALELHIGLFGSSNQLVVSDGATLAAGLGLIGRDPNANRNSTIVTDTGTRWLLSSNLYVGSNGALNRLVIANGARVIGSAAFIGTGTNSSNNIVTVTSPGSVWTNSLDLAVGQAGSGNQLVVSNGARLENTEGIIGNGNTSSNNEVLITGPGSIWTNRQSLYVGESGSRNRLVVNDGGFVRSVIGFIGHNPSSSSNEVVITGAGSLWNIPNSLLVGSAGSGNRLVVTNGGWLRTDGAVIGSSGTNNEVLVTGAGSSWTNLADLRVGQSGSGNVLVVTNGGEVFELQGVIVGRDASSTNNRLIVDGGTLRAQNFGGTAFDVRRGTTILNAGLIEVDRLLLTNSGGFFQFHGGTLSATNSRVSHGTLFDIGNGTSPATFILAGNGLHEFTGILAARVFSNATFTGNGTIGGVAPLQFRPGSRLVPGTSVGKMIFSNSPVLLGTTIMEISRNPDPSGLTNDQIQVIGALTYGGSLQVSNIGPNALVGGNRFPLFAATSYSGSFSNLILPPLDSWLFWSNKLAVDGSIEVVSTLPAAPALSIQRSNDFLLFSWPASATNFALETTFDLTPPVFWQPFTIGSPTNALFLINPAIPDQYFRLAFPASPAAADGFATAAGGVTGGSGGPIVAVSTTEDLRSYATNPEPQTILVLGTFTIGIDELQIGNNKTIIGVGPNPTVVGEVELDGTTNVIVRNLFIQNDGVSGTGDGIRLIGGSHHVWVDHCTFTDCSDGEVDITQASDYVTVSWCKFNYTRDNGHNFVNLIGSNDSDVGNYRLTFHHNWWATLCMSRMVSQRFGECHMYNNYFDCAGNGDATNVRLQAQMWSENNFYNGVANPIFKGFGLTGQLIRTTGNTYTNCTGAIDPGIDTVFTPPYSYTLDSTAMVPLTVTNGAGAKGSP